MKPDRNWCKTLNAKTVEVTLKQFVSSDPSSLDPDAALAPLVYGGSWGIICQLNDLRDLARFSSSFLHYWFGWLLLNVSMNVRIFLFVLQVQNTEKLSFLLEFYLTAV